MPGRRFPIVSHEYYHVFNRGIDRRTTFTSKREFARAKMALGFYQYVHPPLSLSKVLQLDVEKRQKFLLALRENKKLVRVSAFCLMPNHFHLLLTQLVEGGISVFLSNFQNSYTRYFNSCHSRDGALFLNQFKAERIETDEQFLHVSRYVHLNPHTGYVVKTISELENYPWSSLPVYLHKVRSELVDTNEIISFFPTVAKFRTFLSDQADYQRSLKQINHLLLE